MSAILLYHRDRPKAQPTRCRITVHDDNFAVNNLMQFNRLLLPALAYTCYRSNVSAFPFFSTIPDPSVQRKHWG